MEKNMAFALNVFADSKFETARRKAIALYHTASPLDPALSNFVEDTQASFENKKLKLAFVVAKQPEVGKSFENPVLKRYGGARAMMKAGWHLIVCLEAADKGRAVERIFSDLGLGNSIDVRGVSAEFAGQSIIGSVISYSLSPKADGIINQGLPGSVVVFSGVDLREQTGRMIAHCRLLDASTSEATASIMRIGNYICRSSAIATQANPDWHAMKDFRMRVRNGFRFVVAQEASSVNDVFRKVQTLIGHGVNHDGRLPDDSYLTVDQITIVHEGEDVSAAFTEFAKRLKADWFQAMYF